MTRSVVAQPRSSDERAESAAGAGPAGRVRALRRTLGLSQERLAGMLGVSFASVNRWENGSVRPSGRGLRRIAELERTIVVAPAVVSPLPRVVPPPARGFPTINGVPEGARLPVPLTSFVGRRREQAQIRALLATARLVTVTGTGGSGKTRVAIEIGRAASELGTRRWFVTLVGTADADLVGSTVAAALGVRERIGEAVHVALARAIGPKPALLILDNAEHLVDGLRPLVTELLHRCPGLRFLATSQVPLGVVSEQRYPLPPLGADLRSGNAPDGWPVTMSEETDVPDAQGVPDGVRLFVERAVASDPAFSPDAAALPSIARLCDRLDGLPLAIELAAAWVPTFGVEELEERLADRFALLVGGPVGELPRHRTMRSTVEWSRARLSETDARALDRLGIFDGTFDAVAACAVIDRPPQRTAVILRDLVSASLLSVEREGRQTRYRLLETLGEFARECLVAGGEMRAAAAAHAEYYAAFASTTGEELAGSEQASAIRRFVREEANLRAALAWSATEDGAPAIGLRLVAALGRFWYVVGRLGEGIGWIERFATDQDAPDAGAGDANGVNARLRAAALYNGAMLAAEAGRYPLAAAWGAEAEAAWTRLGDPLWAARAITVQGSAAKYVGDVARAEECYGAALAIHRRLGDRAGSAIALNNLAVLATERVAYAAARSRLAESLAIKRELRDERGIAVTLLNLGDVAVLEGRVAQAETFARQSLAAFEALGDQRGVGFALNNLGEAARTRGEHGAAAAWFSRSLAVFRSVGDQRDVALALVNLGRERVAAADADEGRSQFEEALEIARRIGDGRRIAEAEAAIRDASTIPGGAGSAAVRTPREPAGTPRRELTARERGVLEALGDGLSNKEIAARLGISVSTVDRHLVHVYSKLGVAGRVSAVAWSLGRHDASDDS
jgi:non-specific serine/threonine protein kinase